MQNSSRHAKEAAGVVENLMLIVFFTFLSVTTLTDCRTLPFSINKNDHKYKNYILIII
jgi:hypothetical protein